MINIVKDYEEVFCKNTKNLSKMINFKGPGGVKRKKNKGHGTLYVNNVCEVLRNYV